MNSTSSANDLQAPSQVFTPAEIQELVDRIISSGALGRSKIYGNLLQYLLAASVTGKSPKEVEIALDVLGRNADFDVTRDSVVRVYVHQLRKRLDDYYNKHEPHAEHRIVVPKGEYTIAAMSASASVAGADTAVKLRPLPVIWHYGLLILVGLLLMANLVYMSFSDRSAEANPLLQQLADHLIWSAVLDDDLPILVVMGDYYIFGELNEDGRITRMIRDFNINSSLDLNSRFMTDQTLTAQYMDLDLNYLPEGSAYALTRIMPILQSTGKRINVTMMSRLNTADMNSHHIIYVGYISALDKLSNLTFASSGLQTGRTFDELYNRGTGEIYSSDAGLPSRDQPFRDFGLLSTFPAPGGSQIIVIAGTRDAGLMHIAQTAVDPAQLESIQDSLALPYVPTSASYEALYEVFGLQRTNFDANLVYTRALDARRIWGGVSSQ